MSAAVQVETVEQEAARVRALLVAAVEQKGADYVYPKSEKVGHTCQYLSSDGSPSCIVGHVLIAAGVDPVKLSVQEGQRGDKVATRLGIVRHEVVAIALRRAQITQDEGLSWGEALDSFDAWLHREGVVPA